jgi:phosphopantothenoylcysteine decarboxylase/phosphopantothenate--cysteine ligase
VVIAPASADVIAKLAHGHANDLLSTMCLATIAPIAIAPAMNNRMWLHPATRANVALLRERGAQLIGPDDGAQACGEFGPGRLAEPEAIVRALIAARAPSGNGPLAGQRVLVSAGPTYEDLDPVRYIGNRSSGKMGFAIAAAVADYMPAQTVSEKIKKPTDTDSRDTGLTLELVRTPDILAEIAAHPQRPRLVVGFAAETRALAESARDKLQRKRVDAIAANRVGVPGCGFDCDSNALSVYWDNRDGSIGEAELGPAPKTALARELLALLLARIPAKLA